LHQNGHLEECPSCSNQLINNWSVRVYQQPDEKKYILFADTLHKHRINLVSKEKREK